MECCACLMQGGSFELMLFSEKLQQYEKILLEGQRLVVDAEVSQMIDRSDLRPNGSACLAVG